jgi:hypothetical protein
LPLYLRAQADRAFQRSFVAAESLPGAISGVTQVQLRAPDNSHPAASLATMFSLSAGDISVRDTNLLFWVK